ncbi:MAG: hypothetical protein KAJ97_04120 [Acidobacteria bacterium]|nr:hypothetical protein [Acidobacteriota bacterium]
MRMKSVAVVLGVVLCGAGLVMAQTEWEQDLGNPVMGPGPTGSWDEWGHFVLAAVFDGSEYHMWFTVITPEDRPTDIGHATSPDGIEWTIDPDPVLTRGAPGDWDESFVAGAAVIHDGAQFHMWYEGEDGDGISRAGYATSPDGSVWTEYPGNPVMNEGPPGSWDSRGVSPRTVIVDGDRYKMWYTAYGQGMFAGTRVFYAESLDGITWAKHGSPVLNHSIAGWDSGWVANPAVIFDGAAYHMWYAGKEAGAEDFEDGAAIGYASSPDGLAWTRYDDNPVVEATTGFAYTSSVVFDGSIFRMWYSYWDGEVTDWVGYATSETDDMDYVRFIPAAAAAFGAHGAFFQTDVDVSNAGGRSATFHFLWLPRGEDNSEPTTSDTFSLGPGVSVRYGNVLDAIFGLEPDALGALAIVASSPDLLATSRTYNAPVATVAGTYGQAMPAIPVSEFIQTGERRRILFGTENSDMRTNIGCQNGDDLTTVVQLELFDAIGTSLETTTMVLQPLGNDQMNRIFQDHAPVNGCVDVWTDDPDTSFYCYGSVLDNVTSDPTTILPQ